MSWIESLELAVGATTIPVIPIGTFDTSKYGRVPLTEAKAERILANFNRKVLKTDVMVDVDHDMSRSAGWVRSLTMGTFPHSRTGEPIRGLLAEVEWTPYGENLVLGREYRYLSATLGTYHDEENGTDHPDVLFTVSLTNSPVMKMMPSIVMGETPTEESVYVQPQAAVYAFSDFTPEPSDEEPPAPVDEPAEEVAAAVSPVPPKGGMQMNDDIDVVETTENDGSLVLADHVLAERDTALAELAELKAELRAEKVNRALDELSDKGMAEPARNMLKAILLSEGETIELSEGEPVDMTDALIAFAQSVEFVPVVTTALEAPSDEDAISPEREAIRKQLRI